MRNKQLRSQRCRADTFTSTCSSHFHHLEAVHSQIDLQMTNIEGSREADCELSDQGYVDWEIASRIMIMDGV